MTTAVAEPATKPIRKRPCQPILLAARLAISRTCCSSSDSALSSSFLTTRCLFTLCVIRYVINRTPARYKNAIEQWMCNLMSSVFGIAKSVGLVANDVERFLSPAISLGKTGGTFISPNDQASTRLVIEMSDSASSEDRDSCRSGDGKFVPAAASKG